MKPTSPGDRPNQPVSKWHGWKALALTVVICAVVVLVIRWQRDEEPPMVGPKYPDGKVVIQGRIPPRPPNPNIHSVLITEEPDGRKLVHIKTKAEGDEFLVDAQTGKLVSIRDSQGRILWPPDSPMSKFDPPLKSS